MTIVYFVRHAEPDLSNHNDLTRPLSKKGLADCQKLIEYFSNQNISAIYSSPYKRAVETIQPVAKQKKLKVKRIEAFRERKVGDSWISNFHEFCESQWANFDYKLPKGESLRQTQQRNIKALEFVIKNHEKQRVIIAGHGNAIGTVINYFDPTFDYLKFKAIQPIMPFIAKFSFSDSLKQYRIIKLL